MHSLSPKNGDKTKRRIDKYINIRIKKRRLQIYNLQYIISISVVLQDFQTKI